MTTVVDKPPYRVPTMGEVRALPADGPTVATTFAGCGGSALGYRMAGFRVLWANEIDAHAADCHELNDDLKMDRRDIREVAADDVLEACGGPPDVLDGSPPCQGFSTAGRRRVGDARNSLFGEFARLLRGVRPRAFVAENVSGMARGTMKGLFKEVLRALRAAGYRVECRMLDAQWLGVPQSRRRLIFVGTREGLEPGPAFPRPLPHRYSVRDACPWIGRLAVRDFENGSREITNRPCTAISCTATRSGFNRPGCEIEPEADISRYAIGREWDRLRPSEKGRYLNFVKANADEPCPSVTAAGGNSSTATVVHPTERRKFAIAELLRIMSFPDDFRLCGSYAQRWRVLGNAVPPVMMYWIAKTLREEVLDRIGGQDE